jgi:DNA-binding protein HU-beta
VTKGDLIVRMAEASGWPKTVTERGMRAMLSTIRTALKRGEAVTLVGFGTFSVSRLKPRAVKNPRTGRPVAIGGRVPRFRPSKELKQAIRS